MAYYYYYYKNRTRSTQFIKASKHYITMQKNIKKGKIHILRTIITYSRNTHILCVKWCWTLAYSLFANCQCCCLHDGYAAELCSCSYWHLALLLVSTTYLQSYGVCFVVIDCQQQIVASFRH